MSASSGTPQAIEREARLLDPIRRAADLHIDTTNTRYHELRDLIRRRVGAREGHALSLQFESFGFKRGVPLDADMVFDARCLANRVEQPRLSLDGLVQRAVPLGEGMAAARLAEALDEHVDTGFQVDDLGLDAERGDVRDRRGEPLEAG